MATPDPIPPAVAASVATQTRTALSVTIDSAVLLAHRIRLGITQDELRQQSGRSLRTIQRIERGHGRVLFPTARALAYAMKIDVRELLFELGDQPDTTSFRRQCPHANPTCLRCLVQRIRASRPPTQTSINATNT